MLTRLEIQDFALIEHAVILPGPGLNIITGETGAGKSILIDALGAIAGNRIGKDMVRSGKDKAVVEAVFSVPLDHLPSGMAENLGLEGEEIYLSREITVSGKNTARLNGRLVPAGVLREIGSQLLDIHGQYDNQSIFSTDTHLSLLDRFGGQDVLRALDAYTSAYREHADCIRRIQEKGGDPGERERRQDMLRFQLSEIESLHPLANEDTELTQRRKIAANMTHILESLQKSHVLLAGDEEIPATALLAMAESALVTAASGMVEAQAILSSVQEARYILEGAATSLRTLLDTVEDDPEELEKIDLRLDMLYRLKRKYGGSLGAVLDYADKAAMELAEADQDRDLLEKLEKKREVLQARLVNLAEQLHALREGCACGLADRICAELDALDMKGVRFHVALVPASTEETLGRRGNDTAEFLISPNPGEPLRPLARIASGGEASRIMLAIKTILAKADRIPVLIFDEIDTGVSGRTAGKVGEKLQQLSVGRQIFCITHIAQIAAMADQHWLIEKNSDENRTWTVLRELELPDREKELARLLSGGIGDETARQLASRLMGQASLNRSQVNAAPANGFE